MTVPYKIGEVVDLKLLDSDWMKLWKHGLTASFQVKDRGFMLVGRPVKLLQRPSIRMRITAVSLVN